MTIPLDVDRETSQLLDDLRAGIVGTLGARLGGLYLYGSLTTGDFTPGVSDVDLLAATAEDVTDAELDLLRRMHDELVRAFPAWENRVEVAYLSLDGLRTFRTRSSPLVIISPGEPLHRISAGGDWLMNWYLVRTGGVTLHGPPPEALIPSISLEEFIAAVRAHAEAWGEIVQTRDSIHEQSYAVLTLCRAFYTARHGEHVSKARAAAWAMDALPGYRDLIADALVWRVTPEPEGDPETFHPRTVRFVNVVRESIARLTAERCTSPHPEDR